MFQSLFFHSRNQADPAGRAHPLPDAPERRPTLERWVIHPFLLAIFPVLGFYVRNTAEVPLGDLLMPVAVVFLLTLATWLFATCLLRNSLRAGLFTTLCLIPFYSGRQIPRLVDLK